MWSFKPANDIKSDHESTPEKMVAINNSATEKQLQQAKLMQVKAQVMNYLMNDCNQGMKLANRSNILWLVNHDQKEIILKGVNLGQVCISSASSQYLQELVKPSAYKLRIE